MITLKIIENYFQIVDQNRRKIVTLKSSSNSSLYVYPNKIFNQQINESNYIFVSAFFDNIELFQ
jgi:hypothetical protein